jgi:transcriptional regulator with XRE-family HTH domain
MMRVSVPAQMLRWAIERADASEEQLRRRFQMLDGWISGQYQPTLKQLEAFAKATHTPIGYLFLKNPPEERIPIPDYRTAAARGIAHPSPNLLETIYLCQQRQEWYRDYVRSIGSDRLPFVGSAHRNDDVISTARQISDALGFSIERRRQDNTWAESLRRFINQADELGVMVMVSGVVGSNNTRRLDVEEFRGFALADEYAPLIFINGSDTKSAQMFTLAHELAHLWLGESALSDVTARDEPDHHVERWCDQVAAELLVPRHAVLASFRSGEPLRGTLDRLAREFKVSPDIS